MPELTMTSPYVHSRIDQHMYHGEILCQSRLYPSVMDYKFGHSKSGALLILVTLLHDNTLNADSVLLLIVLSHKCPENNG
jgi:hypothetical protein